MNFTNTDLEAIQTIRGLSIDAIEKAKSGHPGMPLGTAPLAYVLWKHFLKFIRKIHWLNRDTKTTNARKYFSCVFAYTEQS